MVFLAIRLKRRKGEEEKGGSSSDGGDPYTGLDRFSRVIDQYWAKAGTTTDQFQYGYDRNSNRLFRDNRVNDNFDELYHTNGAGYDNFNQLLGFARGPLNAARDSITTPAYYQKWMDGATWTTGNAVSTLDVQGNWTSVNTNGVIQTREHNKQNQTTAVSGQTSPLYDNNGAMTRDETGKALTYDAWGRVVRVNNGSTHNYVYDALGRRIIDQNATVKEFYYSDQWQVLEERHNLAVKLQYVWSPVYVDALVLRDRDANGLSGDGLDERLYVQQDANWNTTAVVWYNGSQWEVMERYAYEPYGKPFFYDASWNSLGSSAVAWVYLHQGGRYEPATGYYHFRNRELSPTLGRWNRQDPAAFIDGTNLYCYVGNTPTSSVDPVGLQQVPGWPAVVPPTKAKLDFDYVLEPQAGMNGGFQTQTLWKVTGAKKDGVIIQQVNYQFAVEDAKGKDVDVNLYFLGVFTTKNWPYQEAWTVKGGQTETVQAGQMREYLMREKKPDKVYDDHLYFQGFVDKKQPRTKGVLIITATAKFYEECPVPSNFKIFDKPPTNALPAILGLPRNSKLPDGGSNEVERRYQIKWDATQGDVVSTISKKDGK